MPEYVNLFFLGLVYGLTVCSFSCLPYYAPYLMATGTGFKDGLVSSIIFAGGKLVVYSSLGGAAALFGTILPINHGQRVIIGCLLIVVAMTVPFIRKRECSKVWCNTGKRFSMFTLGVLSSFIPCPPLAAVLVLAAGSGGLSSGLMYGFCYGAGLLFSPMLLMGGGMALVSHKIRQEMSELSPWMEKLAMVIMVIMALKIMS